jgi:uncharacterized membrane protein
MEYLAQFHPIVVHFPIALLSFYVLFEIVTLFLKNKEFEKFVLILLLAGTLAGLAAVLTGNQAEEFAEDKFEKAKTGMSSETIENVIEEHEEYATITLWFFAALSALRIGLLVTKKFNRTFKILFVVLALVGGFLIYQTGAHGGVLVYKYGIGTELIK